MHRNLFNDTLEKFLKIMKLDERVMQQYRNYCIKLRNQIESRVDIEGLTEQEKKDVLKKERDKAYHELGISCLNDLDEDLKENIEGLLEEMHIKHLHILPSGELETLLIPFGIEYTHNKNKWVIDAINYIAEWQTEGLETEDSLVKFLKRVLD